jgi:hypothetical protein
MQIGDKLLTKKQLAERWQKSERMINEYVSKGLLKPCKNVPGEIRFNLPYILKLEGTELEPHSPIEWRRLENELAETTKERDYLRSVIAELNKVMSKAICEQAQKAM